MRKLLQRLFGKTPERPVISGRTFVNTIVDMDAAWYDRCHFEGCTFLWRASKDLELSNSHCIGCQWHFDGAAARTVQTLRNFANDPQLHAVFCATFGVVHQLPASPTEIN